MAALVALVATPAAGSQEPSAPLQLGVLPNLSARVILQHYQPMRQYLERGLKRPVEIVTAPDFRTFHQRTLRGDYDVVVTAAHLARIAQVDSGYVALARYLPSIRGLLVTSRERPLKAVEDLRGTAVAFANPQSLIALRGLGWLADHGLRPGVEFTITTAPTEDSLGTVVLTGKAAAAILSADELRQVPEEQRARLVVFTTFAEVPGFTVMANPRVTPDAAAALRAQILAFGDSAEGKQFQAATGVQGFREVAPADLRALDPYLPETRRLLGGTPR